MDPPKRCIQILILSFLLLAVFFLLAACLGHFRTLSLLKTKRLDGGTASSPRCSCSSSSLYSHSEVHTFPSIEELDCRVDCLGIRKSCDLSIFGVDQSSPGILHALLPWSWSVFSTAFWTRLDPLLSLLLGVDKSSLQTSMQFPRSMNITLILERILALTHASFVNRTRSFSLPSTPSCSTFECKFVDILIKEGYGNPKMVLAESVMSLLGFIDINLPLGYSSLFSYAKYRQLLSLPILYLFERNISLCIGPSLPLPMIFSAGETFREGMSSSTKVLLDSFVLSALGEESTVDILVARSSGFSGYLWKTGEEEVVSLVAERDTLSSLLPADLKRLGEGDQISGLLEKGYTGAETSNSFVDDMITRSEWMLLHCSFALVVVAVIALLSRFVMSETSTKMSRFYSALRTFLYHVRHPQAPIIIPANHPSLLSLADFQDQFLASNTVQENGGQAFNLRADPPAPQGQNLPDGRNNAEPNQGPIDVDRPDNIPPLRDDRLNLGGIRQIVGIHAVPQNLNGPVDVVRMRRSLILGELRQSFLSLLFSTFLFASGVFSLMLSDYQLLNSWATGLFLFLSSVVDPFCPRYSVAPLFLLRISTVFLNHAYPLSHSTGLALSTFFFSVVAVLFTLQGRLARFTRTPLNRGAHQQPVPNQLPPRPVPEARAAAADQNPPEERVDSAPSLSPSSPPSSSSESAFQEERMMSSEVDGSSSISYDSLHTDDSRSEPDEMLSVRQRSVHSQSDVDLSTSESHLESLID